MQVSKFTAELMGYLSVSEWKTSLQLYDEMKKDWKAEGRIQVFVLIVSIVWPDIAEEFRGPSIGKIYVSLEELTSQGLAEWRWRADPPEVIEQRGGRLRMEWRLTESGHRVRASLPSEITEPEEIFVPA